MPTMSSSQKPEVISYLEAIYEPELLRVANMLSIMVDTKEYQLTGLPDMSGIDAETQIIVLDGILESSVPVVDDLYEAIQEERKLRDELSKYIAKIKGDDKSLAEAWFAVGKQNHDIDNLVGKAKKMQREYALHLSAAKVQKGKAQRTIHRVSPTTTTTSVAPHTTRD